MIGLLPSNPNSSFKMTNILNYIKKVNANFDEKCGILLFLQNTSESSSGVEHHLAKVRVAGSNPVFRSFLFKSCSSGGIGRHVGLKIQ